MRCEAACCSVFTLSHAGHLQHVRLQDLHLHFRSEREKVWSRVLFSLFASRLVPYMHSRDGRAGARTHPYPALLVKTYTLLTHVVKSRAAPRYVQESRGSSS